MPDGHDAYAALRNPNYRRLLLGTLLASAGGEMQSVAVGWELYQRTDSATALGLVGLVQFLPFLLLSLPAGHVADRYNRKYLLIVSRTGMALASLGLALLSYYQGPIPLVYLCLLFIGTCGAFNFPARWSLLPQVVTESELHNAITWNSSSWQVASVVGPGLGGLVIAVTGHAAGNYLLAALFSLACAGLIALIKPRAGGPSREALSLRSFLAGLHFVWATQPVLATITLDLFAVLLGGALALLPIFAKDILQVGPTGLGWLRAAPSLGALTTALLLAHRPPMRRPGWSMLWAVTGFGAATIGFGLSRNFYVSFGLLALTGAFDNVSVVVRSTLVQVLTPDGLRGRVTAVNAIFVVSSNELGAFESGITAQLFGPVISVVGGGIGTILVVLAVMLSWPQVLRLGPLRPTRRVVEEAERAQEELAGRIATE
ncbi:MAG TPA: MFS transporter [Gemmataceae bacterium]|nr:MFS transporter [Gemmataceae bacterium]